MGMMALVASLMILARGTGGPSASSFSSSSGADGGVVPCAAASATALCGGMALD